MSNLYYRDIVGNVRVAELTEYPNGDVTIKIGIYNKMYNSTDELHFTSLDMVKRAFKGWVEVENPDDVEDELDKRFKNKNDARKLLPMKAKLMNEKKLTFPCIVQYKYNGVRAVMEHYSDKSDMFATDRVRILSMNNIEYYLPHITDKLTLKQFISADGGLIRYDGEVYKHNTPLEIIRQKLPYYKKNGGVSKSSLPSNDLIYVTYDLAIDGVPQLKRLQLLRELYNSNVHTCKGVIKLAPFFIVNSYDEIKNIYDKALEDNYEGVIIRSIDNYYNFGGRTYEMMKWKPIYETECKILDITYEGVSDGNMEIVMFELKSDVSDVIFRCTPGDRNESWTNEMKLDVYNNKYKYIGKMATITYRNRSVSGKPLHANVKTIRNYE